MNQEDFNMRVIELEAKYHILERKLAENTSLTTQAVNNTQYLVEWAEAAKGAFKVLEFFGKLAKPVGWLVLVGTAIATFITALKSGLKVP